MKFKKFDLRKIWADDKILKSLIHVSLGGKCGFLRQRNLKREKSLVNIKKCHAVFKLKKNSMQSLQIIKNSMLSLQIKKNSMLSLQVKKNSMQSLQIKKFYAKATN